MTDIGRLKELEEKATPAPWTVSFYPNGQANCIDCENVKIGGTSKLFDVRGWGYFTGKGHGALGLPPLDGVVLQRTNAELVSALRNAAPHLLSEIETLRAENERLKAALTQIADYPSQHLWGGNSHAMGRAEGHRVCAAIARSALAAYDQGKVTICDAAPTEGE